MSGSAISLWHFWGLGLIVLSLSSIVYHWHSTITRIPGSIAWVGVRDEAFSKPRAWIRELFAGLSTVHEGYVTVSPFPEKKISYNFLSDIFFGYFYFSTTNSPGLRGVLIVQPKRKTVCPARHSRQTEYHLTQRTLSLARRPTRRCPQLTQSPQQQVRRRISHPAHPPRP